MKISISKFVFAGLIATFITTASMAKSSSNEDEKESCSLQTLQGTYSFSTLGNLGSAPIALAGYIYFDGKGSGDTEFLGSTSALHLPVSPPSFSYSQEQSTKSCIFNYDLKVTDQEFIFTSVSIFASPNTSRIQGISTHDGVNYSFQAERISNKNLIIISPLPSLQ